MLVIGVLAVAGCGDGKSGSTAEFATVYAMPTSGTFVTGGGAVNLSTTSPVTANLVITTTVYPSATTAENLTIEKTTVTLVPAIAGNVALTLPASATPQYPAANPILIAPGATTTVAIDIDTDSVKSYLQGVLSAGASASYWVVVTFDVREHGTGKPGTITFNNSLKLTFTNS
ncbi:hypothetical protein [Geomonas limicola]|nr:hypothetical protein [Geomonas limicola]